jgi:hypothetical protein
MLRLILFVLTLSVFTIVRSSTPSLSTGASASHVYFIRHAEKPNAGLELSTRGIARATCIQSLFSAEPFNIKHIFAMKPISKADGLHRRRALDTVAPLARKLGIAVNTECDRDEAACLANLVSAALAKHDGDVLVCWEHKQLTELVKALGDHHDMKYPAQHFDLIWTYSSTNFSKVESVKSQQCRGLDGSRLY